jgi:hypothetical protein
VTSSSLVIASMNPFRYSSGSTVSSITAFSRLRRESSSAPVTVYCQFNHTGRTVLSRRVSNALYALFASSRASNAFFCYL